MKQFSRLAILSLTLLVCVGIDQSTKMLAQIYLYGQASIALFHDVFFLVYAENPGVMLGIGSELPERLRFVLFVLLIGVVLVAAITFVLIKPLRNITVFAISLIVGGGIGNLIDRLIREGSVIDFMLIKIGMLESGIFNVADLAIILGTSMLCFLFFSSKSKRGRLYL